MHDDVAAQFPMIPAYTSSSQLPELSSSKQAPLHLGSPDREQTKASTRVHLPTPHTPHVLARNYDDVQSPVSPLARNACEDSFQPSFPLQFGPSAHSLNHLDLSCRSPSPTIHPMLLVTPESSPLAPRTSRRMVTPSLTRDSSPLDRTPIGSAVVRPRADQSDAFLEDPITPRGPGSIMSPPLSVRSSPTRPHSPMTVAEVQSQLSSPFMGMLSATESHLTAGVDEAFSRTSKNHDPFVKVISHSTTLHSSSSRPVPLPQSKAPQALPPYVLPTSHPEDARAFLQRAHSELAGPVTERESRRPDYLKRAKRLPFQMSSGNASASQIDVLPASSHDLDPRLAAQLTSYEGPSASRLGFGITESPLKGRRITLFQETSEESFEESLLAGGYGKYRMVPPEPQYQHLQQSHLPPADDGVVGANDAKPHQRTFDWIHESPTLSPSVISTLHHPSVESVPDEKEAQKRKRLDAFRGVAEPCRAKLWPVEVEGMGRVLLSTSEEPSPISHEELTPKKRPRSRKKPAHTSAGSRLRSSSPKRVPKLDGGQDGPDWLDAQFPWNLRTRERAEAAKLDEEHRIYWISNFLDRDSDEEFEAEQHEILPSASWGEVLDERPAPARMGRGKMVPLRANPAAEPLGAHVRRGMFFPSDPADARAALLSRRRARTLAYRKQRDSARRDWSDGDASTCEIVCFCRGYDDGRPMVDCDGCRNWYHLQCIGVRSARQLGDEDDDWFCPRCIGPRARRNGGTGLIGRTSPIFTQEPTLVPTDISSASPAKDPLFSSIESQASPLPMWNASRMPSTPRRGSAVASMLDSHADWVVSSRGPLPTPYSSTRDVRVYSTPGLFDACHPDETAYDALSTPSRGPKLGVVVNTPLANWSSRAHSLFQTPLRGRSAVAAARHSSIDAMSRGELPDTPVNRAHDEQGDISVPSGLQAIDMKC